MPDGPKISAEQLEEDGFGAHKYFHCNVAEEEGKVCFCNILSPSCKIHIIQLIGFALFFFTYSTWEGKCVFMEDLYVQPEQRGKGIGTKVLRIAAKQPLIMDLVDGWRRYGKS